MKLKLNKNYKSIVIVIFVCMFALSGCGSSLPKAQITIRVVDEDGKPIEGARVGASGVPGGGPDSSVDNGYTNDEGKVTLVFRSFGMNEFNSRKEGYYTTFTVPFNFSDDNYDDAYRRGRWEPWNPEVELELKSIRDPIPMYVNEVRKLPDSEGEFGYDLIVGDWVSPDGEGKVSDLIFRPNHKRLVNRDDYHYELTVSFSNPGDGLIPVDGLLHNVGSVLRSDHHAPEYGYQSEFVQWIDRAPSKGTDTNRNRHRIFYIRVRSEFDEEGNIKSALYGKIYGDFVNFVYYLNPTPNSRNIEFDRKTNLIPGRRVYRTP